VLPGGVIWESLGGEEDGKWGGRKKKNAWEETLKRVVEKGVAFLGSKRCCRKKKGRLKERHGGREGIRGGKKRPENQIAKKGDKRCSNVTPGYLGKRESQKEREWAHEGGKIKGVREAWVVQVEGGKGRGKKKNVIVAGGLY